jgi:hypothetical protein
MSKLKLASRAFSIIFIINIIYSDAFGNEVEVTPLVAIKEEYNDNIFFSPTNEDIKEDFITTLTPGITLANRTEISEARLATLIHWLEYDKNHELDALDYDSRLKLGYRFTEKTGVNLEALLMKDSRPDRDIGISGLVLAVPRRTQSYNLSVDQAFSEKTKAVLEYEYFTDHFNDPGYYDSTQHNISLGFTKSLSPVINRTSGRFNIGYLFYNAPDMSAENGTCTLGFQHDISEAMIFILDVGSRYTTARFEANPSEFPRDKTETDSGIVGQASLSYRTDLTKGNLSLSQGLESLSGDQGIPERRFVQLAFDRYFTIKFRAGLVGAYYLTVSHAGEYTIDYIDKRNWWVEPRLRYECTPEMIVEASYRRTISNDHVDDDKSKQGRFTVQFAWSSPFTHW